jgi:hypothetical protein
MVPLHCTDALSRPLLMQFRSTRSRKCAAGGTFDGDRSSLKSERPLDIMLRRTRGSSAFAPRSVLQLARTTSFSTNVEVRCIWPAHDLKLIKTSSSDDGMPMTILQSTVVPQETRN